MAYTAWAASTAFAVGDVRRATSSQNSGLVFECTTAGTSGSSEPAWPTDIGSTLTDNTVVWTAISSVYADLSAISPSAIIELFELHYDSTLHGSSDVLRWHAGANDAITGNITWNGNDYARLPVKAEGFEYKNSGSLPRPTLSVANLNCEPVERSTSIRYTTVLYTYVPGPTTNTQGEDQKDEKNESDGVSQQTSFRLLCIFLF